MDLPGGICRVPTIPLRPGGTNLDYDSYPD